MKLKNSSRAIGLTSGLVVIALGATSLFGNFGIGLDPVDPATKCMKPKKILCPLAHDWVRCNSQNRTSCSTTNAKQPSSGDFGQEKSDAYDSEKDGTLAQCYFTGSCKWGFPPMPSRCFVDGGQPATIHEAQVYVLVLTGCGDGDGDAE